jgi:hypothetical protein
LESQLTELECNDKKHGLRLERHCVTIFGEPTIIGEANVNIYIDIIYPIITITAAPRLTKFRPLFDVNLIS